MKCKLLATCPRCNEDFIFDVKWNRFESTVRTNLSDFNFTERYFDYKRRTAEGYLVDDRYKCWLCPVCNKEIDVNLIEAGEELKKLLEEVPDETADR